MNFDDLDEVLDKLGPIEMWEEDHGKKKRVISHCRERFDLGVPTNGEEAMVTSELLVAKAIMETMEMKSDLEKKRRGAIVEIPEEKWTAMEKAASQFESDVLVNSRERGIGKYIDLSATGMRLKYARFGAEGCDKVVFILHDTGENGESYYGLAKQIQEKGGFTVYCVDFRGHGDSTHSREGQYDVPSFVADIESFIVELDLYAHPVALVGFGLGAIIAAAFAGEHEHLVAGLTLIESHPKCREDAVAFHRFQNVIFGSLREAVTFEIAPIWPDNDRRNGKQCIKRMLSKFRKPKGDEVTGVMKLFSQNMAKYEFRIDRKFLFKVPSADEYVRILENVKCHASVYRGEHSEFMDEKDLQDVVSALRRYSKKVIRGKSIPDASHYVFEDQPATLRDYILHSLLISEPDMIVENNASRTPEFLNLKPLPKYATVEDAVRALKPRKIPTEKDVEDALKKLKEECGGNVDCSSDEESEEVKMNRKYSTALANNDSQYFGMVG
jgi:pimeloyl-ACP methyl ester carboxylesterase